MFAPKFCAECTDRELHSSHGDHFRDHFCVYVSGPLSSTLRAKTNDKKRAQKLETLTFLNFWSRSEGLLFFAEFFFELIPGVHLLVHGHTDDGRFDQPPRTQGALGAFGPLKKVASLRDPCPESPKMVGYTFYFMPRTSQNGRPWSHSNVLSFFFLVNFGWPYPTTGCPVSGPKPDLFGRLNLRFFRSHLCKKILFKTAFCFLTGFPVFLLRELPGFRFPGFGPKPQRALVLRTAAMICRFSFENLTSQTGSGKPSGMLL